MQGVVWGMVGEGAGMQGGLHFELAKFDVYLMGAALFILCLLACILYLLIPVHLQALTCASWCRVCAWRMWSRRTCC